MKKIIVAIMCLAAVQCADAKMMTLQEAKEKARAQMNSVQEYMRNKMDGMQIASQAAYESIAADAAAAKQSTVEFIKAHKNELIAAGLIVGTAVTVVAGAKVAESVQKNQRQREGYEADVLRGVDLFNRLADPEQEVLAKKLLLQLRAEQPDVYRDAMSRVRTSLGQREASAVLLKLAQ